MCATRSYVYFDFQESIGYSNTSFWIATIILFLLLAYLLLRKYSPNTLSNSISFICKSLASVGTENHCSPSDERSLSSRCSNAQGKKQIKCKGDLIVAKRKTTYHIDIVYKKKHSTIPNTQQDSALTQYKVLQNMKIK